MKNHGTGFWSSHLRAAENEDVEFLISTGLSLELACERVGVLPETVDKRLRRGCEG